MTALTAGAARAAIRTHLAEHRPSTCTPELIASDQTTNAVSGVDGQAPEIPPGIEQDPLGGMYLVASRGGTLFFQGAAGEPPEAS